MRGVRDSSNPTVLVKPEGSIKVSVLNGSRQVDQVVAGEWLTLKVLPEAGLPRGIYQLSQATPADTKAGAYEGQLVHVDSRSVYQLHGAGIVRHDRATAFRELERTGELPTVGRRYVVGYEGGKCTGALPAQQGQRQADPAKAPAAARGKGADAGF